MTRAATPEEHADRERDYRKHDAPPSLNAHTVTLLARASTTSYDEALALIQQFADVQAGRAVLAALNDQHARTMAILDTTSLIQPANPPSFTVDKSGAVTRVTVTSGRLSEGPTIRRES